MNAWLDRCIPVEDRPGEEIMRIDPVCGMEVDENKVPQNLRSEHLGHFFYFCSQACKDEFERNPQQYVSPPAA